MKKLYKFLIGSIFSLLLIACIFISTNVYASEAVGPTFIINADRPLSYEEMKAQITAEDLTAGDLTSSIVFSDSTYVLREDCKCDPGTYSFKATVTDPSGNSDEQVFYIMSNDVIAPIVKIPSDYTILPGDVITEDDLKELISVVDSIDGTITDYTLEDVDGLLNSSAVIGQYNFNVTAADASGNANTASFVIAVSDEDLPEIKWESTYIINIVEGQSLTKQEIIDFLISSGQVEAEEIATVDCAYFEGNDAPGIYQLSITYADGSINTNTKIKVVADTSEDESTEDNTDNPVVDDNTVDDTNENNDSNIIENFLDKMIEEPIVFYSIIGGLALIVVIGVIIYKKKK